MASLKQHETAVTEEASPPPRRDQWMAFLRYFSEGLDAHFKENPESQFAMVTREEAAQLRDLLAADLDGTDLEKKDPAPVKHPDEPDTAEGNPPPTETRARLWFRAQTEACQGDGRWHRTPYEPWDGPEDDGSRNRACPVKLG